MTAFASLSVLALSLLPVAAVAASGDPIVNAPQIALASNSAATSEGLRPSGSPDCPVAEVAVYSHHTGDFWCAAIR